MATEPDRLHLLYEINRRLATFTDLDDLVRYATQRARELFDAEGCALLLLDSHRREFHFPISSQSEARAGSQERLAEISFPADRGIAGWVVSHGEAVLVQDAANDPRFYGGVDRQTGLVTRTVLCAPLRTRDGNIGVIEVINPGAGSPTQDDLEFLEALANDVAVAQEKALLHDQLRGEAVGLRQVLTLAGGILFVLGFLFGIGAAIGHLARALPMVELLSRPALWIGVVAAAGGALLVGVARGWWGVTASRRFAGAPARGRRRS